MSETTTEQVVDTSAADNSSTANPTNPSADSQASTEAAVVTTTEPASTASTEQNQSTDEDAALASFAKGQGINDLSELSDRERSLLKMARDNKSALDKTKQSQPKLEETSTGLATLGDEATDVQRLAAKVANIEFKENKAKFLEGKDATLEPVMAQIVADARTELGDDAARSLIGNLPFLYSLAEGRKPADTSAAVEEARREERSSMNQSLSAGASDAHATNSKPATPIKVTSDWIRNEYNPNNPEHVALVDAMTKR